MTMQAVVRIMKKQLGLDIRQQRKCWKNIVTNKEFLSKSLSEGSIALVAAALFGMAAVILGAFGAHALKGLLTPEELQWYETGNRYHFYHTFAILTAGFFARSGNNRLFGYAAGAFSAGILLFSGSLYVMALSGLKSFGIITPLGGLAFILGWAMMAVGLHKKEE